MKSVIFLAGRTLQVIGLVTLPASMWAAQMDHNERLSIAIFLASILIFGIGFFFVRSSR